MKNIDETQKQICFACKEHGHLANKCENDPNLHTVVDDIQGYNL